MKVTAKILSALAIMVFMAVPAITSANVMINEVAVEAAAPEGETKEKKECTKEDKKDCEKKEACDKAEKKCCAEKKECTKKEAEKAK